MTDPILLQSGGDVVGPASSTDGSMVLFDGTTGKLLKGNNALVTAAGLALLDDNNSTEQRNTLGLGSISTQNSNAVTISGGVISGITDLAIADGGTGASTAAQAKINLEILFGTAAGTFAQGNDSRIVNAVPNTRTLLGTNGLTGGGALSANQTISLGLPSDINVNSQNSLLTASHTHKLDMASFFGSLMQPNGYFELPGGLLIQWGSTGSYGDHPGGTVYKTINFNKSFSSVFQVIAITEQFSASNARASTVTLAISNKTPNDFTAVLTEYTGAVQNYGIIWFAIGKIN